MHAQERPGAHEPNLTREIRSHAKADRARVRAKLRPGAAADVDLDDPGVGYRLPHHRWHEGAEPRAVPVWRLRRRQQRRVARRTRGA